MSLEEDVKENAQTAAKIIKEYFAGKRSGDMVKIASLSITQHIHLSATIGEAEARKMALVRFTSSDPKELKENILINFPGQVKVKGIEHKK